MSTDHNSTFTIIQDQENSADWTIEEELQKMALHKKHSQPNSHHNVPSQISDRVSLLVRAIEVRDCSSVSSMLALYEELDPNYSLPGLSMPLLHLAVGLSDNCSEIVDILLERGGDPNNLTTEDKVSPLHLSVIYDYEAVLHALIVGGGGDPKLENGDAKNCYDLAKDNVEMELKERCFLYFYRRSVDFRKSMKPSDSVVKAWKERHSETLSLPNLSGGDAFFTCESDCESVSVPVPTTGLASGVRMDHNTESMNGGMNSVKKLWSKFSYLMTEDESEPSGGEEVSRGDQRLSTIEEESAPSVSYQRWLGYEETKTGNLGESIVVASDSSTATEEAETSEPSLSFANCPNPLAPSKMDLIMLQNRMKATQIGGSNLVVPVTKSTFQVLNKFVAQDGGKLADVLAPKVGAFNFSSELKLAMSNLHLIDEWGNLKIDLLVSLTTPSKKSKSFYNYLLLDPKITKKVNFSGTHLKSDVIKNTEKFETFLKSIFYIGKGCGKRPIQHLVDAKDKYGTGKKLTGSHGEKIDRIMNIWRSGLGVIVVSVFHHSSEREANVNEAAMIDAMGLMELSNIKKGSYAGTLASSWPQKSKNQFGSFLLYKSFCAFVVSEHKSFYPQDI